MSESLEATSRGYPSSLASRVKLVSAEFGKQVAVGLKEDATWSFRRVDLTRFTTLQEAFFGFGCGGRKPLTFNRLWKSARRVVINVLNPGPNRYL